MVLLFDQFYALGVGDVFVFGVVHHGHQCHAEVYTQAVDVEETEEGQQREDKSG